MSEAEKELEEAARNVIDLMRDVWRDRPEEYFRTGAYWERRRVWEKAKEKAEYTKRLKPGTIIDAVSLKELREILGIEGEG